MYLNSGHGKPLGLLYSKDGIWLWDQAPYPDSDSTRDIPTQVGRGEKGGTVYFGKAPWLPEWLCILLTACPLLVHLAFIPSHTLPTDEIFVLRFLISASSFPRAADSGDFGGNLNLGVGILHEWVGSQSTWVFPLPLNWVALSPLFIFSPTHLFSPPEFHFSHVWQAT